MSENQGQGQGNAPRRRPPRRKPKPGAQAQAQAVDPVVELWRAVPEPAEPEDITPSGFNARTTVHEYGGGAYLLHEGSVYFSNFADQRLYRQDAGGDPVPITPDTGGLDRYADGRVTPDGRSLVYVR